MENEKIKNAIKEIKEIKMTESERDNILYNIFNSDFKNKNLIQSPWGFYSFTSILKNSRLVYYIVIPLIIILSGGGVVFASQDSLPNNILYPVKVKVLEPVEGVFKFSKIEKAKYQSELAKTRLVEAQELAKENKLDNSTEKKITKLLVNHTDALNKNINKINKNDSKKEIDEIMTDFSAEMKANARILEVMNKKENKDQNDNKKDNYEEDHILPDKARESANDVKENLKNNKNKNKDSYKNKKDELKVLIEDINKDLEEKNLEEFDLEGEFIEDTHEKIEEAKKYLDEVDKKEIEGDEDEVDSLLFDSESSIKEAEILINTKIRFDDEDKKENKKEYKKENKEQD